MDKSNQIEYLLGVAVLSVYEMVKLILETFYPAGLEAGPLVYFAQAEALVIAVGVFLTATAGFRVEHSYKVVCNAVALVLISAVVVWIYFFAQPVNPGLSTYITRDSMCALTQCYLLLQMVPLYRR